MTKRQSAERWYRSTARRYEERVREELDTRWNSWEWDVSRLEYREAVGALLARQASLAIAVGTNQGLWARDLGELVLRAMADVHITLAWILLKPDERSKQFILYGLGQEKLLLEQLTVRGVDDEQTKGMRAWIDSQRYTWLTEVNVGSWSESSVRAMADEAGLGDFYRLSYQPASAAAHSMWNVIARTNLEQCTNSLHRPHRVPVIRNYSPDIYCWFLAAETLSMSVKAFDDATGISVQVESAHALLDAALTRFTDRVGNTGKSSKKKRRTKKR